jgi:hypothetical protein
MIRIIHLRGPLWALQSTSYSQVLKMECKATPGLTWEPINKSWCGYADAIAVAADRSRKKGLNIMGEIPQPAASGLLSASKGLRDYQLAGVDFLLAKASEGCILADDLGLGKSCQATVAARALKQKTVIVCPSFVRSVWLDQELKKWWPAAKVTGLMTTKAAAIDAEADVAVIHYDILHAWVDSIISWGARTCIFDEGHFFRGRVTRRTGAGKKLASACTHRIMLTGTPMPNKIIDVWSPVDVISEGRFGKSFAFGLRHANGHQEQVTPTKTVWKFDGASHLDELNTRLNFGPKSPWGFMLRRLKSDVALELPARSRQVLTLEVPRGHVMAPLQAIRSDRIMRKALDMAADGKFPQVIELTLEHLKAGHKVVVGSHRKRIAELIAEGVRSECSKRVEVVHGEIPMAKRKAIVDSQPDLLCCTIDSTQVGINLSYASVAIVAELVWDPTMIAQWEGRFGRFEGQNILIQYCIARGTADEYIKRAVVLKLDRFVEGVGKRDDQLREELRGLGKEGAAARLAKLAERMMAEDE